MNYRPSSHSSFVSSAAAHWAIPGLEKRVAANPSDWEALNNLGNAYFMQRKTEAALVMFLKAAGVHPIHSVILSNVANAYEDLGEFDKALKWAKLANEANPQDRYAAQVYAECLLRSGQWAMGWDLYEKCRFSIPECPLPKYTGGPLKDVKLLVLQEGGLGDVFLNFRFFRELKEMGAHVTFAVDKKLHCLLELHPWIDKVMPPDGFKVTNKEYDCWVSSFSLAGIFAPTPKDAMQKWPGFYFSGNDLQPRKQLIGRRPKVGLCWSAGESGEYHRHRSLDKYDVERLLGNIDVDWVCLQWPYGTPGTSLPPYAVKTVDISDWEKTAEVIEDLDLVITVETGMMFLAAAIGTPTWVLLRNSFWYFLDRGQASVWFPNMELLRSRGTTYEGAIDLAVRNLNEKLIGAGSRRLTVV